MRLDLYNSPSTKQILAAIGLDEDKIPRIRGVGIEDGKILIHTRTGGGNREHYGSIESYIKGEYGIDGVIKTYADALSDYSNDTWRSKADLSMYEHDWQVPYELTYVFPETEEEWANKEAEMRKTIKELEDQKDEILATAAYTNEYMTRNKYFISDEDEEFDSTYANWWFMVPQEHAEKLLPLEDKIRKAAFGNSEDYIKAVIGGEEEARQRILKRIKEA